MANLQYASDIISDVLFRASEPGDGTSDFNSKVLDHLNRAYAAIYMGGAEVAPEVQEDWWWLRKHPPGILTLSPVVSTGTANVANNSTSASFSSAPAASMANRFFRVDGHPDWFRISAHTGGQTAFTLDSAYTGLTNTAAPFKVVKLEYDLASDVLRVLAPMRVYRTGGYIGDYRVDGVDLDTLEENWPLALLDAGTPEVFAMVTESKVRFNRYGGLSSTDLIRLEYDYLYRPAVLTNTTVEPVVPWQWRKVLADLTLAYLLVDKEDSRAEAYFGLARSGLAAMVRENRHKKALVAKHAGKIAPRLKTLHPRLLRTESGIIIG